MSSTVIIAVSRGIYDFLQMNLNGAVMMARHIAGGLCEERPPDLALKFVTLIDVDEQRVLLKAWRRARRTQSVLQPNGLSTYY
jgi:hypothetical protein